MATWVTTIADCRWFMNVHDGSNSVPTIHDNPRIIGMEL
jgi:hypothetical protein